MELLKNVLAVIGSVTVILFLWSYADFDKSSVRVYDCGMADWHPDIPSDVREECRRLRYEHWKEQQREEKSKISKMT